jgi:predicted acetyltransferase
MTYAAPTRIETVPAAVEEQPVVANLLQLYAHDFSEFQNLELGFDGRFAYSQLPLYWTEPSRHPFLVRVDDRLAGFVLVKRGSEISGDEGVWDMAEFFVVRGCRRRGVGTEIAHSLWRQFSGMWEVRVMQANLSACGFWEHAVSAFTGEATQSTSFEKPGELWRLFSFESKRAPISIPLAAGTP